MIRQLWDCIRNKPTAPQRVEVEAVLAREVNEAARQRLERAIEYRQREVENLLVGVLPKRGGS